MSLKLPAGMTAAYESSASSSYLVVNVRDNVRISWYQVSMLEHNRPGNLLPLETRRKNGEVAFCYDITSRLTLEFLLKRKKLGRNEFIKLLSDLSRPLIDCEGFLLRDSGFLLDAGFIYVNPETLELYLVFLPVAGEDDTTGAFKSFAVDLILEHAVLEEGSCDNFLQRILSFLKKDNFNIRGFQGLLEELAYRPPEQEGAGAEPAAGCGAAKPGEDGGAGAGPGRDNRRLRLIAPLAAQLLAAAVLLPARRLIAAIPGNPDVTWGAVVMIILAMDIVLFKKLFFDKTAAKEKGGRAVKPGRTEKAVAGVRGERSAAGEPALQPTSYPASQPALQPTPYPASQPALQPTPYPASQPALQPTPYPASQPALQPTSYPASQPALQPALQPASQPALHPASHPALQPAVAANPPIQAKTEFLGGWKPAGPMLRSRNPPHFEEIPINKPDFVIGRLPDQADHICRNNAVGKVHALITAREGILYVRDLNSINGTFVNSVRIESNSDVRIKSGDVIAFANSEYVFIDK